MQQYILYMNRLNRKKVLKLTAASLLVFAAGAWIAYSNTRFNGFGDVPPAKHYFELVQSAWQHICNALFSYNRRFISFF